MGLTSLVPDARQLLALEPEELAGLLLQWMRSQPDLEWRGVHVSQYGSGDFVSDYPAEFRDALNAALMEAWAWLQHEGFLVPKPGEHYGWLIFSRRAKAVKTHADVEAFRRAASMPSHLLHQRIKKVAWPAFIRGNFESSVFEAFKEVEVHVRDAAKLDASHFGTRLMQAAFHSEEGPLADGERPAAERQGVLNLFVGAISVFKNPHSHRRLVLDDPHETMEMLVLASHLLRIVDSRKSVGSAT